MGPAAWGGEQGPRRLALCLNVFPQETAADVLAVLAGPVREWRRRVAWAAAGAVPGLYLPAAAAREFHGDPALLARLREAVLAAGGAWTANAFPWGGFHGRRVKERAFLPDWSDPRRLRFTLDVARVLARLLPRGGEGSLSTCPVGYREGARLRAARSHLRAAQEGLRALEDETGVRLVLALEPEPDGTFERAGALLSWLATEVLPDVPSAERRLGLCWDLCHSAVVGEAPAAVLRALRETGLPLGKVQVSAALAHPGPLDAAAGAVLEGLARDPWFHQVRARGPAHEALAWPDLPAFLADPAGRRARRIRVHCHVPLAGPALPAGWRRTDWREAMLLARAAGCRDFEVETYTLPLLPRSWLGREGVPGTLAAEVSAAGSGFEPGAGAARGVAPIEEMPEQTTYPFRAT